MHKTNFQVILEQDEDGWFIADVPALIGCHTQGKTEEEVLENIKDVIKLCVEELTLEGKKISFKYPLVLKIKEVEVLI